MSADCRCSGRRTERPSRVGARSWRDGARGQATVELALLAMLLLLLAFAVFDFGRGFHATLRVSHAARDGARVGMDPAKTNADIISAVNAALSPLVPTDILVTRPAGQVSVRVSYAITTSVPVTAQVWGGSSLSVQRTAVARAS